MIYIKHEPGQEDAAGISELTKYRINGVWQWVFIRGGNAENPLLLYLHGGPGAAEMFNRAAQATLEKHFIVVNWDQRGAGKSYANDIPLNTMNVGQFLSDALTLVSLLRERFGKDKIYLMGHSWGSLLGMLMIREHPELFLAYIGLGQVVNFGRGELISYEYTLDQARKNHNRVAVRELGKIGPPPYQSGINGIAVQRKWLSRFGGVSHRRSSIPVIIRRIISSKAYGVSDFIRFFKGIQFTLKKSGMIRELYGYDLFSLIPEVNVPLYFLAGRYDYNTPWKLVEEYCRHVRAPIKKLIWFEHSAHSPNIEEKDKFCSVLIDEVLGEGAGLADQSPR